MTYKPKHLPPSLDYEAWLTSMESWNNAMQQIKTVMDGAADSLKRMHPILRSALRGPEARAGHDWESRSWWSA